jgi:hypothetical protein
MFVNVWLGIPEADHNELNNDRGQEQSALSDIARRFSRSQLDPDVVQNLYKTRTQGPNTFHLWSIILNDEDGLIPLQINSFRQEYPQARVEGAWLPDGSQLLDDQGVIAYDIDLAAIAAYMPDDPDGTPNPTIRDVNLPYGWAPRDFS